MGLCGSSPSGIGDIDEEIAAAQLQHQNLSRYGGMVLRNQLGEDGKAAKVEHLYDVRVVWLLLFITCNYN